MINWIDFRKKRFQLVQYDQYTRLNALCGKLRQMSGYAMGIEGYN